MKEIRISEYNENWSNLYEEEKILLSTVLPIEIEAIHHIGSTSVLGLAAKPIIDILIEVDDIDWLDNFDRTFELHQYECMGEFGISGRR